MEVGDYVYVLQGIHDQGMPKDRRDGLIVEIKGRERDQAVVMFSNSAFLKFHASQIQVVQNLVKDKGVV